ncbi:MAG: DUF2339 domain-containing protein [Erythrobacter sp.]
MEWFFILGLCTVAILLWDRTQRLERRLFELEQKLIEPLVTNAPNATSQLQAQPEQDSPQEVAARAATRIDPVPASKIAAKEAEPEPAAQVDPASAEPASELEEERKGYKLPKLDFEDLFGRRLPIWAGGIALAAGGIFLVIYAIEQGLMDPVTRVALSLIFGVLLLAGAEVAYRFESRVRDPRVRQALAGAGIATLYAAAYLAGAQYGLIGPAVAFGGLALITAGALVLTERFGLPTAVLGLVGGFATPVMVASEEANVPVLAFYLALLTAGLVLTARRTGQRWFGAAGLAGGFLWGVLMLASQPMAQGDLIAIGLYLLAIGAAVPLLLGESERLPVLRLSAGAIAAVQMGALVSLAGFSLLNWGLYGLLAAALAVLAWRTEELRPAGLLVTAVAAILLGAWPEPASGEFIVVATGLAAVLLGAPLAMLWRRIGGLFALGQVSGGALAFGLAAWWRFGSVDNDVMLPGLAAGLGVLAITTALSAWLVWRDEKLGEAISLPVAASAVLAFGAAHVLLPGWAEVLGAVIVSLGVALVASARARNYPLIALVWAGGLVTIVTLFSTGDIFDELARAFGEREGDVDLVRALMRWGSAVLPFAVLAWLEPLRRMRRLAEVLSVLPGYVLLAQFIPGPALAWTLGLAAIGSVWFMRMRTGLWASALVLGTLWALIPGGEWVGAGIVAFAGQPVWITDLADWEVALRRVLPLALGAGLAAWQCSDRPILRIVLASLTSLAAVITLHVLFKQLFAITDAPTFVALGMAERTVWQALLVGAGIAIMRLAPQQVAQRAGLGLAVAGVAHFVWFTVNLHNPLWSEQAVGPLPVANLLAPAYLIAGAGVWWLSRRSETVLNGYSRQAGDAVLMALIALWSLSELRHAFAGSVLVSAPMTQSEDLLRSFVGIILALGFLWWGSLKGQRSWRIGSLVLILVAVLKVFLVDAAGLEGLLRVASFIALGASLIAIGWVYSRQLSTRGEEPEAPQRRLNPSLLGPHA